MFRRGGRQFRRQPSAGGFTPNKLSGCVLWLRADLGITLNAGNVSAWADQSGNGNGFTQGIANAQPGYSLTGNAKGTGPALTFNGTTQFMSRASSVLGVANLSLFAVYKTTTTAAVQGVCSFGNDLNATGWQFAIDSNAANERDVTGAGVAVMADGTASTNWEEATIMRDSTTWTMFVNGASQALTNNTTSPNAPHAVAGLGTILSTGSAPLSGSIDEIIGYSRKLSAAEQATVEAYIRARTAIW